MSGYGCGCVLVHDCIVASLPGNCCFDWSSGSDLNPDCPVKHPLVCMSKYVFFVYWLSRDANR